MKMNRTQIYGTILFARTRCPHVNRNTVRQRRKDGTSKTTATHLIRKTDYLRDTYWFPQTSVSSSKSNGTELVSNRLILRLVDFARIELVEENDNFRHTHWHALRHARRPWFPQNCWGTLCNKNDSVANDIPYTPWHNSSIVKQSRSQLIFTWSLLSC